MSRRQRGTSVSWTGGSLRLEHRQVRQKISDGCGTGYDVPTVDSQSPCLSFPPPSPPSERTLFSWEAFKRHSMHGQACMSMYVW